MYLTHCTELNQMVSSSYSDSSQEERKKNPAPMNESLKFSQLSHYHLDGSVILVTRVAPIQSAF